MMSKQALAIDFLQNIATHCRFTPKQEAFVGAVMKKIEKNRRVAESN